MKFRGEGPNTINMQDILEEISLGMLTRVVFMVKKLSLGQMGKSQFGEAKKMWLLEVEKI